jgi:hypothetical protein
MTIYGITGKESVLNNKRLERKVNQGKIFSINQDEEREEEISSENINLLSSVNPFLVLNELNSEERDKEELKKEGKRLIYSLNQVRLALLNGELSISTIDSLKSALDQSNYSFQSLEIKSLIDEIKLRAEVELAKLELVD